MAATLTVPQHLQHCNFIPIKPRHGVITLFGYGIKVHVDRGHLILHDGIGAVRRAGRLPRVGHGLRRLVVLGSDGIRTQPSSCWNATARCLQRLVRSHRPMFGCDGPKVWRTRRGSR